MSPPSRRPSMADVAGRAGVSYQTVSRVLNGERWVSDDAKAAVASASASVAPEGESLLR